MRAAGGTVTREAGPVKGGTTVIAFVQDPDGYKIELIERRKWSQAQRRRRVAGPWGGACGRLEYEARRMPYGTRLAGSQMPPHRTRL